MVSSQLERCKDLITIKNAKKWQLLLYSTALPLLEAKPGFASMGSTGGGGGGGSSSGGSGGSGGNSIGYLVAVTGWMLYDGLNRILDIRRVREDLNEIGCPNRDRWILTPNMTIADFELRYNKLSGIKSEPDEEAMINLYARAQFAYGDAIRRHYAGQENYMSDLDGYLGHTFLSTMKDEIELKAKKGIIDDVIVSHGKIEDYKFITPDILLAKVHARGTDREVNSEEDFDASYERQEWEDYVVFGRCFGTWRIYNLVYGDHFHLDGKNFNDQASLLAGEKYIERNLPDLNPELKDQAISFSKSRKKKAVGEQFVIAILFLIWMFLPWLVIRAGITTVVWLIICGFDLLLGTSKVHVKSSDNDNNNDFDDDDDDDW